MRATPRSGGGGDRDSESRLRLHEPARRGRGASPRPARRLLACRGPGQDPMTPEERLAELGYELPAPNPAVGTYVGAVTVGSIVFVSGHGPYKDGEFVFKGKLGREVDVATGQDAARLTIVNLLASLKAEI